ncbi:MAG: efflux RND transporter permease subunit [Verrucomicrobiae bacterium]|nr:efflux RND transporter permease subunit [Verrucomicrobiae bacterium]
MDSLIHWALRHRTAVLFLALVLLVVGGNSALRMPVDVFPDLTAPTVTVLTEAGGMAADEAEVQVTIPLETSINGAPGVRRVRSASTTGLSILWAEFAWGTDLRAARQVVSERVALASADLPAEVDRPIIAPTSSIMGEILFLALTSDTVPPRELRTYAETVIRRRLLSVPGVSQVIAIGGAQKQHQVALSPDRLVARGVSLAEVADALASANLNAPAGVIPQRNIEWLVTGVGRMRTSNDIAATVVRSLDGVPLTVGDLGGVRIGNAPRRGDAALNGREAVVLGLQKQPGANTLELTRRLDLVLDDLATRLPEGVTLHRHVFRQADFIQVAVDNVRKALSEGIFFVVLVILAFLGSLRATVISVVAIPLSLAAAVVALDLSGATINTMTLGGMAIAIGALVDDAVIDVENVFRRLRENTALPESARRAVLRVVLDASIEIRSSIVFATAIIALVFVPVFFLEGIEGRLLRPLGTAYLTALGASLLVAVTVTPALCLLLLPRSRAVETAHEPRVVRTMKRAYGRVLTPVLNHPWAVPIPTMALLVVALAVLPQFGRGFLPDFNEGTLTISAVTIPGTSLDESGRIAQLAERVLLEHPEVASVTRRTGRAERDEHAQGVESSELDVSLRPGGRSKQAFLEDLRESLSAVPGMSFSIGQPISHRMDHMLSGTRAAIAIKLFGPGLRPLRDLAARVETAVHDVPGVVDLSVEPQADIPNLRARFDRAALARHGLTIREVARTLEAAVRGITVTRILEDQRAVDLTLRLETDGMPMAVDELGDLLVRTPSGAYVPLSTLADLVRDTGPNVIGREQLERKLVVSCNVAGRDVTGVVEDLRRRVEPLLASLPGYRVEFGGQFESAASAQRRLLVVGGAVVGAVVLLLATVLGGARDAAIVMLNLPLCLIGAVAGVALTGGVLNVASMIGFITVFGISTRNGIMLLTHIHHLQRREGVGNFREAVTQGALERLAPITMTALAAALALIPLALGAGRPGSEIQSPMATVILCGLLTSLPLDLLILPALYLRFGRPRSAEALRPFP